MPTATGARVALVFGPHRPTDAARNFPTGLGLIAAVLRNAGHEVHVIEVKGEGLSREAVMARLARFDPDVVGIGGLITTYGYAKWLTHALKQWRPDLPVMIGGGLGSSVPDLVLERAGADVAVIGEAEETVLELVPRLLAREPLDDVAGIAFLDDDRVHVTDPRPLIQDLDALPFPAWDLFPMDEYLKHPVVGLGRDMDLISSRGCPNRCTYCYQVFGRRFRARSAENIVEEIRLLDRDYGLDFVSFQDDCFVINRQRVYDFCDRLDGAGLDIRWSCCGRVNLVTPDLLKRMRESGCVSVNFGIESGSQRILNTVKKGVTVEQAGRAVRMVRDAGLRCPTSFMLGSPGETRKTAMETVRFCRDLAIPLSALMLTTPYPGTALFDEARAAGRIPDLEAYVLRLGDCVDFTINLTAMPDHELLSLRDTMLEMIRDTVPVPDAADRERADRLLYGDALYEKGRRQLDQPEEQRHRAQHGFNEGTGTADPAPERPALRVIPRADVSSGEAADPAPCFIIAEAGVNHDGQIGKAISLVWAAARAGADAVKFQAFTTGRLVTAGAAAADYQRAATGAATQRDLLCSLELSRDDLRLLKQEAEALGIDFLASPFDPDQVRTLVKLGVTRLKIASPELIDAPLVKACARTGLPLIVSTGAATESEIAQAIDLIRASGDPPVTLLACVTRYPTPRHAANLRAMQTLRDRFDLPVGYSDHTAGIEVAPLAAAAGAAVIEKHLTLDRRAAGPDHAASVEPDELAALVRSVRRTERALGTGLLGADAAERSVADAARKSIVAAVPIAEGARILGNMLALRRPGTGLPPTAIRRVIGARAAVTIEPDTPITETLLCRSSSSRPTLTTKRSA